MLIMSIKNKFTNLLFGEKPEEPEPARKEPEPVDEVPPELASPSAFSMSLLELSEDHPIFRLHAQRRHEAGYLPAPRICLDEEGVLSPEMVHRELNRLRTVLIAACSARLKAAQGTKKKEEKKKKDDKKKDPKDEKKKHEKKNEKKNGAAQDEGPAVLDAQPFLYLSADKLYAWMLVFPPVGKGAELSREMLYEALVSQEITYGVDTRLIDQLSHNDKRYFNLYLVAKGKPAFDGKNGNIVDNFPRKIQRVLEVDEFDQVDYTSLNLIHNADKGEEICHLIKPTEGEPGRSVQGEETPAKSGKPVPLPRGKNTEISEDGTQLLASIAGSVEFTGNVFQVKPVLEIAGDVDFSTGSINFLGDINIHGNVLSGFTVQAGGNINIDGVVEAGSSVEAGGDLAVVKGILGDGTTTVQARGSIFSKYVENAVICVRENLQTDCIISSSVYCGGEVLVQSGRGKIMGGWVWAARRICANAVGSQSECKTTVALGGRPCASFEREIVQREVNALEMEMEKLECQPDSPVKTSLLSKTRLKLTAAEMKMRQLEERMQRMAPEEKREGQGNERLECSVAYPGTKIRFGDDAIRLHQIYRRCVATKVHGEILLM